MKFGRHADLSVRQVYDTKRSYLTWTYYNCSMISFTDEVLLALDLTGEWLIPKPGINPEMHDKKHADILSKTSMATLKKEKRHFENKLDAVEPDPILLPKSFVTKPEKIKSKGSEMWLNRNVANSNMQFVEREKDFNPVYLKKTIDKINKQISEKYKSFGGHKIEISLTPDLATGHQILETLNKMVEIGRGSSKPHRFNGVMYGSGVALKKVTRAFFLPAALSTGLFEIDTHPTTNETGWRWTGVKPKSSHVKDMTTWLAKHKAEKVDIQVPVYLFSKDKEELMFFKSKKEAYDYFGVAPATLNYWIKSGRLINNMYYIHTSRYAFVIV